MSKSLPQENIAKITVTRPAKYEAPVLMFHYFHDGDKYPKVQGSLSASELADIIEHVGVGNFTPPMEFFDKLQAGRLTPNDHLLTFDDNLAEQYDIALPVLEKYGLHGVWSITTGPYGDDPNRGRLEIYRSYRNSFKTVDDFYDEFFAAVEASVYADDYAKAMSTFVVSEYLKAHTFYSDSDRKFRFVRDKVLGPAKYYEMMDAAIGDRVEEIRSGLWMSPEQILRLHTTGHIVALHTETHQTDMSVLPKSDVEYEWSTCVSRLSLMLKGSGWTPLVASYPCGIWSEDNVSVLEGLGVKMAFITGTMAPADPIPWHAVPRTDSADAHKVAQEWKSVVQSVAAQFCCIVCESRRPPSIVSKSLHYYDPVKSGVLVTASCSVCTHTQLSPLPDSEAMAAFFLSNEETTRLAENEAIIRAKQAPDVRRRLNWIAETGLQPGSKILDVGCGFGYTVDALVKNGYEAFGIDFGSDRLKFAISTQKGSFEAGALDENYAKAHEGEFDAIITTHVVNQVGDPKGFMGLCLRVLKPGGRLLIEVPNLEDETVTLSPAYAGFYYKLPTLSYWSQSSFRSALSNMGLRSSDYVIAGAQRYSYDNFINWMTTGKPQIRPSTSTRYHAVESRYRAHRVASMSCDTLLLTVTKPLAVPPPNISIVSSSSAPPSIRDAILSFIAASGFNPRTADAWNLGMGAAIASSSSLGLIGAIPFELRYWALVNHKGEFFKGLVAHETCVAMTPSSRGSGLGSQLQDLIASSPPASLACACREHPDSPAYKWYSKNGFQPWYTVNVYTRDLDRTSDLPPPVTSPSEYSLLPLGHVGIPWSSMTSLSQEARAGQSGYVVDRDLETWLASHPYSTRYSFWVALHKDSSGKLLSYAIAGMGVLHSVKARLDVLDFVVSPSVDTSQESTNLLTHLLHSGAEYGWSPLRCAIADSDPLKTTLEALGLASTWSYDMMVRVLDPELLSRFDPSTQKWKHRALDYI
jgi:2-polyprenyl-3-methyl-5-hydroxy-6-metoxy-1,4-benzoquinol methylase